MASEPPSSQERSEQPTGKRREEARRQGRVAVSADLAAAGALLGALAAHVMTGGQVLADAVGLLHDGLRPRPGDLTVPGALALLGDAAASLLRLAWPLVALPAGVGVAAVLLQTRFVLSAEPLRPRWSRLGLREGLARLLGIQGLVALTRALLKLAVVGTVAWLSLRADWPALFALEAGEPALATVGGMAADLWLRVGLAYLALAAADYGYHLWRHQRSLRMTREEVRREVKETEGNPALRARLRALHRQLATRRMMAEVRRADVVLRNPTHVAVALRYLAGRMRAPRVVARGERLLALRIVEEARRAGVPVVENPPLARALFRAVGPGREIPAAFYRAVAEVLAHVYALRRGAGA